MDVWTTEFNSSVSLDDASISSSVPIVSTEYVNVMKLNSGVFPEGDCVNAENSGVSQEGALRMKT